MIFLLKLSVVLLASVTAGVALTALVVVLPVLLRLERTTALEVFKPFFDWTHLLVLFVSILTSVLAFFVSSLSGNWSWFLVSLLAHLNGPYTVVMMMPLNRRLMSNMRDSTDEDICSDLRKWGSLHSVRVALNMLVFIAFLLLLV